jgi:hypothetical protein
MGRNRQIDGARPIIFSGARFGTTKVSPYGALVKRIAPVIPGCEPIIQSGRRTSALARIPDPSRTSHEVRNVPCVDGSGLARTFFTSQAWSVLPCVRPLGAVHMTAGHNALRGSGPGQQPAFDDAMAQVGCPDRRIDRLCITCCSPSQPSHHAGSPARSRYRASAAGCL